MKCSCIYLILAILLCCSCNDDKIPGIFSTASVEDALIISSNNILPVRGVAVHSKQKPVTLRYTRSFSHVIAPMDVELINFPPDWDFIELLNEEIGSGNQTIQKSALIPFDKITLQAEKQKAEEWTVGSIIGAIVGGLFLLLITLYFITGISIAYTQFGGDSLQVCYIIGIIVTFILILPHFDTFYYYTFIGLYFTACACFMAARTSGFEPSKNLYHGSIYGVHALAIISMLVIIFIPKETPAKTFWASHDCLELNIPLSMRHKIELIGAESKVLKSFTIQPDIDIITLLHWPEKKDPANLKLISIDGDFIIISIDERPEHDH